MIFLQFQEKLLKIEPWKITSVFYNIFFDLGGILLFPLHIPFLPAPFPTPTTPLSPRDLSWSRFWDAISSTLSCPMAGPVRSNTQFAFTCPVPLRSHRYLPQPPFPPSPVPTPRFGACLSSNMSLFISHASLQVDLHFSNVPARFPLYSLVLFRFFYSHPLT